MAITISTPGIGGNVTITLAELKSPKSTHQPLAEEISDWADVKSDITLDATPKPSKIPPENLDPSYVVQEDQVEEVAEDASSESDSDLDPTLEQPTMSERRRIQNLMFNSLLVIRKFWALVPTSNPRASRVNQRAETVTKDEIKVAVQSAADEELSIRSLMLRQESSRIISDPREYQMELFEKAKRQNTIAVLDTGPRSGYKLILAFFS